MYLNIEDYKVYCFKPFQSPHIINKKFIPIDQ